jgi:hypothetical protein
VPNCRCWTSPPPACRPLGPPNPNDNDRRPARRLLRQSPRRPGWRMRQVALRPDCWNCGGAAAFPRSRGLASGPLAWPCARCSRATELRGCCSREASEMRPKCISRAPPGSVAAAVAWPQPMAESAYRRDAPPPIALCLLWPRAAGWIIISGSRSSWPRRAPFCSDRGFWAGIPERARDDTAADGENGQEDCAGGI